MKSNKHMCFRESNPKPTWVIGAIFDCPICLTRWVASNDGPKGPGHYWHTDYTRPKPEIIEQIVKATSLTPDQADEALSHLSAEQVLSFEGFVKLPNFHAVLQATIRAIQLGK